MAPLLKFERSPTLQARVDQLFTPIVVAELQSLEQDLGGRSVLVGMLALAPLTRDLQYILGLIGDPTHAHKSLAELCCIANVLPGDLLKHLAQAALAKGRVLAAQRIGAGIPAVAEDIMQRAAPYEDACNGGCGGTGTITPEPTPEQPNPSPLPCETCRGTGRLVYRPDLERQKLAVELAQLLPKGGGVQIAVQQNNQGQAGGGSLGLGVLERLQAVTDKILYGDDQGLTPPTHSAADQGAESPLEGVVVDPPLGEGEEGGGEGGDVQ